MMSLQLRLQLYHLLFTIFIRLPRLIRKECKTQSLYLRLDIFFQRNRFYLIRVNTKQVENILFNLQKAAFQIVFWLELSCPIVLIKVVPEQLIRIRLDKKIKIDKILITHSRCLLNQLQINRLIGSKEEASFHMHRSGILRRNLYKSQIRKGLQLRPLRLLLCKVHLIILFSNEFLILLPLLLGELFIVSKYEFVPIPLNTFPDIINWSKYASRAITLNGVNFWYHCWGR